MSLQPWAKRYAGEQHPSPRTIVDVSPAAGGEGTLNLRPELRRRAKGETIGTIQRQAMRRDLSEAFSTSEDVLDIMSPTSPRTRSMPSTT